MIYQWCSRCGKPLPEAQFSRDAKSATGRRSECKKCNLLVSKEKRRAYYLKNKEKLKAMAKERYLKKKGE